MSGETPARGDRDRATFESLDEVRAKANRQFPAEYLEGIESTLCLFGATTLGRSELVHVLDAAVPRVTVVDPFWKKLRDVERLFPPEWSYSRDELLAWCGTARDEGRRYDVVICDGSPSIVDHVWEDVVPVAASLARTWALFRITGDYLADYGFEPTAAGVDSLLKRLHGTGVEPARLVKRSSGKGGTFWALFAAEELGQAAAGAGRGAVRCGAPEAESQVEPDRLVHLQDLLGHQACADLTSCRAVVNGFREGVFQKQRQAIFRVHTTELSPFAAGQSMQ